MPKKIIEEIKERLTLAKLIWWLATTIFFTSLGIATTAYNIISKNDQIELNAKDIRVLKTNDSTLFKQFDEIKTVKSDIPELIKEMQSMKKALEDFNTKFSDEFLDLYKQGYYKK